jgi:hypothetical protein
VDELPSIQNRIGVMEGSSLKPGEWGKFEKSSVWRKVSFAPISAHLMEVSM